MATPALVLTVRTRWLPTIGTSSDELVGTATSASSGPPLWERILRPRYTVTTPLGTLVDSAPAGDPGRSLWPFLVVGVAVVLVVLVVLAAVGVVSLVRRKV